MNVEKMSEFKALLETHTQHSGPIQTAVKDFFVYRSADTRPYCAIYETGIVILASGKKYCSLNGKTYEYGAGQYLGVFLPMPVEVQKIEASPEHPMLMAALRMDLGKIAEMLLKLDKLCPPSPKTPESPGMFTSPLDETLLDPIIRLLHMLDSPTDVAMLSGGVIDEIYYRVLTSKHVAAIRALLQQRGQIQQISRAVDYISAHIAQPITIEELATHVNMSVSHFHKTFKEVAQMPPLQYAKSMKLFKAQSLMQAGEKASQAAFAVGYSSTAQFSREYKRQFGFAPSATTASISLRI